MEILQSSEVLIRLGWFVGLFVLITTLESMFPRRVRQVLRRRRWPSNIGVSGLSQLLVRLLLPISAIALAVTAEHNQWGVLAHVNLPTWLEVVIAILVLDLAIYWQHRIFHSVPLLWRFHQMHHADTEFDISTGVRFHPLSVLLSACIKLAAIVALGPAPIAVFVFEVLLNGTSLFNHSNLKLHPVAERMMRYVVVTPDMHRVHHSSDLGEMNCNFGFSFPWWDRIFRSYQAQPSKGHLDMEIGLNVYRDVKELRIDRMLTQPFRTQPLLRSQKVV